MRIPVPGATNPELKFTVRFEPRRYKFELDPLLKCRIV